MKKYLIFIIGCLTVLSCQFKVDNQMINKEKFKEGQVWKYETRENEDSSQLIILKIEEYPKNQIIVHIAIDDVKIKSPENKDSIITYIEHLPFYLKALERSVTKKVKDNYTIPDFNDGYDVWKLFFDEGDADAFSTSVKEAVEYTEATMEQEK